MQKIFNIIFFLALFLMFSGCTATPVRYAERLHYDKEGKKPTQKGIALGTILDKRYIENGKLDVKQIKLSVEEIRLTMVTYFLQAGRFDKVIKIIPEFSESKFTDLINTARKSDCDYLLIGEVTRFDINFYGNTWRLIPCIVMDVLFFPINLIVPIITAGESFFFNGSLIAVAVVEANISVTFNLVDVRSGKTLKTFVSSERVRDPATSYEMMGSYYDSSDDWLDLGRRLGRYTIENMSIKIIDELADFILSREHKEK